MSKILGLDIGINSIGWALTEENECIVDCGVRIFPVGVKEDDYNKTGSEISKNASRRLSRTIRRGYFRYKMRRKQLIQLLDKMSMLPGDDLIRIPSKSLYALRKKALDKQVSLQELGRVLLLLNQRRGFKSSKKDSVNGENTKEQSEMKLQMHELERQMLDANCRTIGEYFYLLFQNNTSDPNSYNSEEPVAKIRGKHVERKLYSNEFDLIWNKQKEFYPDVLNEENRKKIKDDCIYYQRKLKSQKHLVGKCWFEPTKRCSPISSFEFQEFRLWQTINNIRVTINDRFRSKLTFDEKQKLFAIMNKVETLTLSQLKKELGFSSRTIFNDLPDNLKGNTTHARIAKAVGEQYWSFDENKKRLLWHTLFFANDEDWLIEYAKNKLDFTQQQALKYASVHLEDGYSSVSSKALLKGKDNDVFENGILYHLKKGIDYQDAALAAGYHHSFNKEENDPNRILADKIVINPREFIRNPLVQQCISESVRLVNSIIKKHGRPDLIRIEMARSLKKPKSEREKIKRRNDDTQRKRDEYREFLKNRFGKEYINKAEILKFELFLEMEYAQDDLRKLNNRIDIDEFKKFTKNVKSSDKEKYQLWLECGRLSPYTGNVISLSQLFSSEIDVEHIIPYSKCMNDSFANKTLCERHINEEKGDRTPFEYLGADPTRWKDFKDRIRYFKDSKQEQFTLRELPDDFLSSQLNNTAYVAREVVAHFKKVCKDVRVTNGQATSLLRKFWGLNDLLNPEGVNEKSRHDHRHHTVDAIVIAFTSQAYIQKLSTESTFNEYGKIRVEGVKFPYPAFKLDVNDHLQKIFVSYRNKKRLMGVKTNFYTHSKSDKQKKQRTYQVRGSLHEETNYGRIKHPDTGEYVYVVKKPVNLIDTEKQVDKIVDRQIRQLVKDRIANHNGKIKQALAQPIFFKTKDGKNVPIKSVRMVDNSENLITIRPNENGNLFVSSGNNYCIAIYEDDNGKREFDTVTFYDAVKRKKVGDPIIPLTKNHKKLLLSLKQKDMVVLYETHPDEIEWANKKDLFNRLCRVIKFDVTGQIFFGRHNISKIDVKTDRNINLFQQRHSTIKAVKVKINTVGELEKVVE